MASFYKITPLSLTNTSMPCQHSSATHTKPAQNPLALPDCSLKQNFATSTELKFDNINFSEDQTRVSSTRSVSGTLV